MKPFLPVLSLACGLMLTAGWPSTATAQTAAARDCFWTADASTWKTLGLDTQQVRLLDSLRLHYPEVRQVPSDSAPTGDRILARGAEEEARIRQQAENPAPTSTAGAVTPAGERVDGQPEAPTSGGNTTSIIRTPAETQQGFNTNPADDPKRTGAVPETARPVPQPYPSRSLAGNNPRPLATVEDQRYEDTRLQGDVSSAMRGVLTPEQWKEWERWCGAQPLK